MEQGGPFIRLTLDCKEPIELGDFVSAFTSLGAEYERFVKFKNPDSGGATLYIKQVREGSIIADLWPWVAGVGTLALAGGGTVLAALGGFNVVDEFVERLGNRISQYKSKGGRVEDATKTEIDHYGAFLAAVSHNRDSSMTTAAMERIQGNETTRVVVQFNTVEAQEIQQRLGEHKAELEHLSRVSHERVLMQFTETNTNKAKTGKPTGHKVRIGKISQDARKVFYATDLVKAQMEHEIQEADDNIYKKVFDVDVNVENLNGKPYAYRITAIHGVENEDE